MPYLFLIIYRQTYIEKIFDTVTMLAGHKWKKLRIKRVGYLLHNFSKRQPTATDEQQQQLIKTFSERDYPDHDEFVKAKQRSVIDPDTSSIISSKSYLPSL